MYWEFCFKDVGCDRDCLSCMWMYWKVIENVFISNNDCRFWYWVFWGFVERIFIIFERWVECEMCGGEFWFGKVCDVKSWI